MHVLGFVPPVSPVVDFVIGVMAVLLIMAWIVWKAFFDRLVAHIPVVGGWIQSGVNAIFGIILGELGQWLSELTRPFTYVFWPLMLWGWRHLWAGVLAVASAKRVALAAWNRAGILYGQAINYANLIGGQAGSFALSLYRNAIGYANRIGTQAGALAVSLYQSAISYANVVGAQAGAYALALFNQSVAFTQATANSLHSDIGAVEARVDQLIGTDVTRLVQDITQVANTAQMEVTNAVKEAEATARTLSAGAEADAIAQTKAVLQPQIDKIKTAVDTCLEPLCATVTPNAKELGNLGKLLHLLGDNALLGLVLAFFVEAVADPEAAATQVDEVLGPVSQAAAVGLRDLIGV